MSTINEKITKFYDIFKGLPIENPIVRNNIENDAFEIVVYDLIFRRTKYIEELKQDDIEELEKWIVPPPDDGIDIFYEEEDLDEPIFHIVQIKNSKLDASSIKTCFSVMKDTIRRFLNDRRGVSDNLREVISRTNFDKDYENNCIFYVVHTGDKGFIRGQEDNEKIITLTQLEDLQKSIRSLCVPFEKIKMDRMGTNILFYPLQDTAESIQCNLNAYDLALLCNKYMSSEIGRNILFGQNLRDSLGNKSQTYSSMVETIDKDPEKFWFYNNGITIIADDYNVVKIENSDELTIKNFSIINGAQTVSTFGKYLINSEQHSEDSKIENLKKVYVSSRIIKTKEENLRLNITIRNNTQNPISSRDMVSNNIEQRKMQSKFLEGKEPFVFIQIRRGETKPRKQFLKHQSIANDELAQLLFSYFLGNPFTARDKKRTFFNYDNTFEGLINKEYSRLFNYSDNELEKGVIFKKSKEDIDELLFIRYLHSKAKKYLKDSYISKIDLFTKKLEHELENEEEKKKINSQIILLNNLKQINNICLFYNLALYYEFKKQFDELLGKNKKIFDYEKFYDKDKAFQLELVKDFANIFLSKTIEIIRELSKTSNPPYWIRLKSSEKDFFTRLTEQMNINDSYKDEYEKFLNKYKK